MKNKSRSAPDFLVQWCDSAREFESHIYLEEPELNTDGLLQEKLREPLVLLETATTCVAVTELCWAEPTSVSLVPNRPAFCMMASASPQFSGQYGYGDAQDTPALLSNVFFLRPGKKFTGCGGPGSVRSVMVSFDAAYAEGVMGNLNDLSEQQWERALTIQNSLITSLLFRLLKEAMHPGNMSEAVVDSCGHALLVECVDWLNATPDEDAVRGRLTPRHLAIIEEYLNSVQGKLPSVAELAKACSMSERHFLKLFREEKKCSVAQYIKSFQLVRAKTYLLDTDLPLKEIAYRLGFSTYSNFSAAFRSATGQTPGQIRKSR